MIVNLTKSDKEKKEKRKQRGTEHSFSECYAWAVETRREARWGELSIEQGDYATAKRQFDALLADHPNHCPPFLSFREPLS